MIDADAVVGRALSGVDLVDDTATHTDSGNAARLIRLHGGKLRYTAKWAKWLVWDRNVWSIDDGDVHVRELAKDVGREIMHEAADMLEGAAHFKFGTQSLGATRISGAVNLARGIDGVLVDHQLLDSDAYMLGVQNGVIDLRTGKLQPARPNDLMTMQAPTPYDPDARAPRFEQALEEWFPDPAVRSYLQRLTGAAIVGEQRDHVFGIHYGNGSNGKGTFMRALRSALGRYCVVIHLSLLEQTRHKEHDTEKAHLFRSRIAIASETQRRIRLDEASVKNLTGGDPIHARRMREDPWEFEPTHSLWLQTNHLPQIGGRDGGIWRRIRVLKWVNTFEGRQQDQSLDEKLRAESPGTLAWAVRGCLEWQQNGLAEPEAVIRDTLAYRAAENTFERFATDSGLQFRQGLRVAAGELQRMLIDWAEAEGTRPATKELADWLRDNGASQKNEWVRSDPQDPKSKLKRQKFWVRVGIRTDGTADPDSFSGSRQNGGKTEKTSELVMDSDDTAQDGTDGTATPVIGLPRARMGVNWKSGSIGSIWEEEEDLEAEWERLQERAEEE